MKSKLLKMKGLFEGTDFKDTVLFISEWVLCVILLIVAFLIFYYTDYSDTLDNSVMLVEAIWNNRFLDYYQYAAQNAHANTVYTANYNIFLYGVFAVWNLPIIILHGLTGFSYMDSVGALLWCKLFILLAVFLTAFLMRKIMKLYLSDKSSLIIAQILFLGCSCTLIPTVVAGQYDILALVLILLGIYYYLKDNDVLFLIFFSIALPLKSFAIFVFAPLLLLKEKRIIHLILKCMLVFSIQFIVTIPFWGNSWYKLCIETQNRDAKNLLTTANVNIAGIPINLFFISFIVVCVFCYISEFDKENVYLPIWSSFAALSTVFLFVNFRSYWIVLIVPFAIFTVYFNTKNIRANLLLLIIGMSCYTVHSLMNHAVYSMPDLITTLGLSYFKDTILPVEQLKYGSIAGFFEYFNLVDYSYILRSIFVIAMMLLLALNFPKQGIVQKWKVSNIYPEHGFVFFQLIISYGIIVLLLYANIVPKDTIAYMAGGETEYMEENVLDNTVIEQTFILPEAEQEVVVNEISFLARNNDISRVNRNAVHFTLVDNTENKNLFHEVLGAGLIQNESTTSIKLDDVILEMGHEYLLRIQGEVTRYMSGIYFAKCSATDEMRKLSVNGITVPGELVFTLH